MQRSKDENKSIMHNAYALYTGIFSFTYLHPIIGITNGHGREDHGGIHIRVFFGLVIQSVVFIARRRVLAPPATTAQ
jgi:hypothetical protein